MKRFRVSCRCSVGTGGEKRGRERGAVGRDDWQRERAREKVRIVPWHTQTARSTRRRMAADHEARTIKPFCRKTPVIKPPPPDGYLVHEHRPPFLAAPSAPAAAADRLLLRCFSFHARFFSSLVFHSRLSFPPPLASLSSSRRRGPRFLFLFAAPSSRCSRRSRLCFLPVMGLVERRCRESTRPVVDREPTLCKPRVARRVHAAERIKLPAPMELRNRAGEETRF